MVSLYIDDDPDGPWISLGTALAVAQAAQEIGNVARKHNESYPELFGFYETAMEQKATSAKWRRKVSKQAGDVLEQFTSEFSIHTVSVLKALRDQPLSGKRRMRSSRTIKRRSRKSRKGPRQG